MPLHELEEVVRTMRLLTGATECGGEFLESGIEPGLAAELMSVHVIGVTFDSMRNDQERWPKLAYERDKFLQVRFVAGDPAVGNAQVAPRCDSKDSRRFGGFARTDLLCSTSAELALRQFRERHGMAQTDEFSNRSAAGQLDIIWMCADGQNVSVHVSPSIDESAKI